MSDFSYNDRRHGGSSRNNPNAAFDATIKKSGISIQRARQETSGGLPFGDPRREQAEVYEHLASRKVQGTSPIRRTAASSGSSVQIATSRSHDPMWNWRNNNMPVNFTDPDELARVREFCNTPDAPIMMADGTTKPIGDVVVGDLVMGWTYRIGWNGRMSQQYVPTEVLATGRRQAPNVVRMSMASGKQITATADHRWFNPYYTKERDLATGPFPIDWTRRVERQIKEYLPASVGSELAAPTNIRQILNPAVGKMSVSDQTFDKVLSITPVEGTNEVVSLQTATGNYIAWGYCSKNCRLLYVTHPIVSACIDVYSKLPMQGLTFSCKDPQLVDFYSELFLDQLDYENHLLKLGRQYWLAGESWSLGGWNETLGVWQEDELVNPDDIEIERDLFLKDPRYLMRLPQSIRDLISTRQPFWRYEKLMQQYPELALYGGQDDMMPVSNIVLQQMRFEADDFSNRGIPILLRAMRTLIQEEMLNSALDSIADRLYTPLILAKLGAKASDLGGTQPWIPSQTDMEDFNSSLDAALAADFRVMTYHWALDMEPVFGKENVPDLSNDFDRIVERILMVFGLSQTMLTGASAGETYAADALNRDVVTQLLSHYQTMQAKFVKSRAMIVAEAQGHFDYEVRGGMRYVQTEEVWVVDDPDTGEGHLEEIPKLLVPDLTFKVLNLSDEEQERQFVESLAESGVPVPYRARLLSAGIDLDEAVEERSQEEVMLAVAEQETRRKKYMALKRAGLPIAQDLKDDFDPKAVQPGQQAVMPGLDQATPTLGGQEEIPGLAPTPDELAEVQQDEQQGVGPDGQPMDGSDDPNAGQDVDEQGDPSSRPEESDEERADMPKAASLSKEAVQHNAAFQRFGRAQVMQATARNYSAPDNSREVDGEGNPIVKNFQPEGRWGDPRHVGMRRFVPVPRELSARRQDEDHEDQ